MTDTLSNTINYNIWQPHYQYDPTQIILYDYTTTKINLPEIREKPVYRLVTCRHRNDQTPELLQRLRDALCQCQHTDWLATRKITNTTGIYSINYNLLSEQDCLDLYLCPSDHILDEFGEHPIDGPVFLDTRNGELAGVCVRNVTTNLDYAGAAKYSFSNFGWFLFGYDLYDSDDEIVIVEGVFDALALRHFGYRAIAVGSCNPTAFQLACLQYKYSNISICFDNDFWGHYGAYVAATHLRCPILLPGQPGDTANKDPSCYHEAGISLELRPITIKELHQLLIEETAGYNKIIDSGQPLIRPLPYNAK